MLKQFGTMALLACAVTFAVSVQADQLLFVAAMRDHAILAYGVNPKTGVLTLKCKTVLSGQPGVMTTSPDGSLIYAGVDKDGQSSMVTLKRSGDGCLKVLGKAKFNGSACYLSTDNNGKFLLLADYGAGEVTVMRIVDGLCTDEVVDHKKTERTAHCIALDPTGTFAFVPHVTPNKVYQFHFDNKQGTLTPNDPPFVDGPEKGHKYNDPRHYVHHPKLDMAYTSSEFGGGITAWKFDPQTGTLERGTTLSSLSPDASGEMYAADIQMTPNGRFAYVSNRDQTNSRTGEQKQDTLTGFALDPKTGEPSLVGYFPTPNQPRSFCIDRSGRFLYSAGTDTSTLFAYRIDPKRGSLEKFATYETGTLPAWVLCLESPN